MSGRGPICPGSEKSSYQSNAFERKKPLSNGVTAKEKVSHFDHY